MKLVFSNQHVSLQLFTTSGTTCAYKQKYIFIMAEHDALLLELRQAKPFFVSLFENMECQVVSTCNMERHVPVLGLQQVKVWLAVARLVLCPSCLPPTPLHPSPHPTTPTTTLPSPSCHQLPLLLALALQPATSIQS